MTKASCHLLRSPDLEQLYQQFSSGQRRTSLVVTNMIDILARLIILLLTWPSGWGGVACNWLACLSVILWSGICMLVLTRKEVMMSVLWLRYAGTCASWSGQLELRAGCLTVSVSGTCLWSAGSLRFCRSWSVLSFGLRVITPGTSASPFSPLTPSCPSLCCGPLLLGQSRPSWTWCWMSSVTMVTSPSSER